MAKNKVINLIMRLKGAKQAEAGVKGVDRSVGKLIKSAAGLAAGYFSTRGLINAFKFATNAAGEQERQEKKLETALGRVSKSLLAQACALQRVTTFGDEAIIGVQASIAMFTDNEDAIKRATQATLDMATATGMDLKSAGDLVAKSLGSSTNALSRYGIVVEGAVGSSERLDTLTKNIADKMGGQAAAAAETYLGQLQQLSNVFGDIAERMGTKLIPTIVEFITPLKETMETWLKYRDAVEGVGSGVLRLTPELRHMAKTLEEQDIILQSTEKNTAEYFFQLKLVKNLTKEYKDALDAYNASRETEKENAEIITDQTTKAAEAAFGYAAGLEAINAASEAHQNSILSEIAFQQLWIKLQEKRKKAKEEQMTQDLKAAALSGQSAKEAMKSVVRAESMEAVAGYISSVLKSVPFPFNIVLAAAGGGLVAGLIDKGLSAFATGGDFVTSGPQTIIVGDNPGGRERVQVTPLSSPNVDGPKGITLNFNAPVTNADFVRDVIAPELEKAVSLA